MYINFVSEIKNRLTLSMVSLMCSAIVCYRYKETLLYVYIKPCFLSVENKPVYFIYTNISDLLNTYISIIITTTFPIVLASLIHQILCFLKPGLYDYEHKTLKLYVRIMYSLYASCFMLVYNVLVPLSWNFFSSFQKNVNKSHGVEFFFEAKLDEYLNFVTYVFNLCAINIALLTIIFYVIYIKSKNLNSISESRKYIYFTFFVIASVITPPDVFSQMLIGMTTIIVFELFVYTINILNHVIKNNFKVTN